MIPLGRTIWMPRSWPTCFLCRLRLNEGEIASLQLFEKDGAVFHAFVHQVCQDKVMNTADPRWIDRSFMDAPAASATELGSPRSYNETPDDPDPPDDAGGASVTAPLRPAPSGGSSSASPTMEAGDYEVFLPAISEVRGPEILYHGVSEKFAEHICRTYKPNASGGRRPGWRRIGTS